MLLSHPNVFLYCYRIKIFLYSLTLIGPCIANIFAGYKQQDAAFLNLFTFVRRCTSFRRFFHPSSGAQNCTYSIRHLSDRYCYLLLAWKASSSSSNGLTNTWRCMCSFELLMMDGKTRLKHIQRLTEINKLWNVAFCWLYPANNPVLFSLSGFFELDHK